MQIDKIWSNVTSSCRPCLTSVFKDVEPLSVHNLQSFPCFVSAAVLCLFHRTTAHALHYKFVKSQTTVLMHNISGQIMLYKHFCVNCMYRSSFKSFWGSVKSLNHSLKMLSLLFRIKGTNYSFNWPITINKLRQYLG